MQEKQHLKQVTQIRKQFISEAHQTGRAQERNTRDWRSNRDDRDGVRRRSRSREKEFQEPTSTHASRQENRRMHNADDSRRKDKKESVKEEDFLIEKQEIEQIKAMHLGTDPKTDRNKIKRKFGGDKFRQVFKEDWDASEDTSIDINPLYAKR